MLLSFKTARRVFLLIGFVFILSGLTVTALNVAQVIPAQYDWQGPLFLVLGATGLGAASWGLREARVWPVAVLTVAYVPWTVLGLIGDARQGYWPLVAGEATGLALIAWALVSTIPAILDARRVK